MRGGDEDRATRVSSLANEEPLVVVKACIYIMREVVRKDCGDGRGGMIRKGKTPLCCGGCGSVLERALSVENGDISRGWSSGVHQGPEVFTTRRGDKDVIRINSDVLVEWGKKEGIKDFLSYLGGGRRHSR